MRPLTLVVHGESGVGKSYLADGAPGPRLILDVEGGTRFTPSQKVQWDPRAGIPELGPDDTAVVTVHDLGAIQQTYQWLTQIETPFRSVIVDSLTEVQKRYIDKIAGADQMKLQDYGELARKTESLVRSFRDLTMLPHPVEVVVFVTGSREKGQDHPVVRPLLVGSAAEQIGYFVDVMAQLSVTVGPDGQLVRRALFAQVNGVAAKDRTGRLGVTMDDPTIPLILDTVYGPEQQEA